MSQLRKVYLGNCMAELIQQYRAPELENRTLLDLVGASVSEHKQMLKYELEGDEERCLICLVNLYHLITFVIKMPEYSNQHRYVLNKEAFSSFVDKTRRIKESLRRRYETLSTQSIWEISLYSRRYARLVRRRKLAFCVRGDCSPQYQLEQIFKYLRENRSKLTSSIGVSSHLSVGLRRKALYLRI